MFEHADTSSNLEENCLISFWDSSKKPIYETRSNKKPLMICPFLLNISTILSISITSRILKKTVKIVSENQIRKEYMEQETIRSIL